MDNQYGFRGLDKSVKKQRIIDTAAALFHKKGYSSTSLDDVSKELGITKAAIYHYVENKDELLSIIYTQAFENIFRDTVTYYYKYISHKISLNSSTIS